jgi:hypothetical protein
MAAKTPRPAGIHRSSPADDTRGAPRTRCRRIDALVGTVSAFAQAVPADRVIAFTADEADD